MSASQMPARKPVVLCILDGWGIGDGGEFDAIASAHTPNFDKMMVSYPNTTLTTFGPAVGLPDGQMGNSEVGHMNIGAGRIVMQFLPRVDAAFASGEVANNADIQNMIKTLKSTGRDCHIMGLLSDGGVHAHIEHVLKLAKITAGAGVKTYIHGFMDGRDCAPKSGLHFVEQLIHNIEGIENIVLATLCGRYYAMDRDNRWERVEIAYNTIVNAEGENTDNPISVIKRSYADGTTDEFIKPVICNDYKGWGDGDGLIFANFRSDRAREILNALLFENFDGFKRQGGQKKISSAIAMVEYSEGLNALMPVLFPPLEHKNILGAVIAGAGLKQVRMAETEKYPHVTFFFNAGDENPYPGEERILVNSPKVATYDLQPEMSAPELGEKLLSAIDSDKFDVVIVNFANTDMVGHTGSVEAARKAAEAVDTILGKLEKLVLSKGGVLLVTADHGNADQMYDPTTKGPHTAHTLNPVPFIVVGAGDVTLKDNGKLADIAPVVLHFLGVGKPAEMDGDCLVC